MRVSIEDINIMGQGGWTDHGQTGDFSLVDLAEPHNLVVNHRDNF